MEWVETYKDAKYEVITVPATLSSFPLLERGIKGDLVMNLSSFTKKQSRP